MLKSIKGIYENDKIILEETPDFNDRVNVIVTFFGRNTTSKKRRVAGSLKGKIWYSDDFDEPLEHLKDYM